MSEPRLALVTGASRGIGRAVALTLAQRGFRIVAVARAQRALEELDDAIRAAGGDATLVPLDLKDGDGVDRLGASIYERWGKLDALVACAGVLGPLTPAHQATPGVMSEVLTINLLANHRLIRAMHPLLRAAEAGRALFVTSGAVQRPRAYWGPYAASKAGLEALVKCYAAEVAITPIRVNLFSPGATRTAMRAKAYPGEDPMTLKTPEDVAAQIAPLLDVSCTRNGDVIDYKAP